MSAHPPEPLPTSDARPVEGTQAELQTVWQRIDGGAALLGGTANVIMQLAYLPVGHGVVESVVDSGNVMLHPLKRLRTTLTYIAIAMFGADEERVRYRAAVNGQHRHVHSGPDSTVEYDAFDPHLQQWVAACLYHGAVDLVERMHGPTDPEEADALYHLGARFGTTLQMPPEMWPEDRQAFRQFWARNLERTHIDDTTRAYFDDLLDLKMVPRPFQLVFARFHRWVSTGLLPPRLREQMGLTWSRRDERRLNRTLRVIGAVSERLSGALRRFPLNAYLWDARRRMRTGRPLV